MSDSFTPEEEQALWDALPGNPGSPMDLDMSLADILGGRREGDDTDSDGDDDADRSGGGGTGADAAPPEEEVEPPSQPTPPQVESQGQHNDEEQDREVEIPLHIENFFLWPIKSLMVSYWSQIRQP